MGVLTGLRIVITRAAHQAEDLARPLREHGAEPVLLPLIAIGPPRDGAPLEEAAAHANDYDWIIFSSANAISAFTHQLRHPAGTLKARIATVGSATRHAAEEHGFTVTATPEEFVAESLLQALTAESLKNCRILIPTAAVTRDVIAPELRRRGARVDVIEAYRNLLPPEAAQQASQIFRHPYPDWVTLASSSAAHNLVHLIKAEPLRHVRIASIGPLTSETVRKHGLEVTAEAAMHNVEGLVEAIIRATAG